MRHKTDFERVEDVESALDKVIDEMTSHEVSRRMKAYVGFVGFRLHNPIEDATSQLATHVEHLESLASSSALAELKATSEADVQRITRLNRRREEFDGKKMLREFYTRFLHQTGMSFEIFVYECAQEASSRKSVSSFVNGLIEQVRSVAR